MVTMSGRIAEMRQGLYDGLVAQGSTLPWNHITDQIGMFAFTGLTPEQCTRMIEEHKVYMTMNGRISIAGLNPGNLEYVAAAMDDVTRQ